jgi:hypothetical protein
MTGLGDLAAIPSGKMSELLHHMAEEAFADALGESLQKYHLRIRRVGGKRRKKSLTGFGLGKQK